MPTFNTIRLLGKEGNYDRSADRLHSDKLKSVLFVTAKTLYGDAIDKSFLEAFSISSAYPFLQIAEDYCYFFPKPHSPRFPVSVADEIKEKAVKRLRKVEYIDQSLFETILAGVDNETTLKVSADNFTENNRLLSQQHILKDRRIYKSQVEHHVKIPRLMDNAAVKAKKYLQPQRAGMIGDDSEPFDTDKLFFESKAGLYFLLKVREEEETVQRQLNAALRLLEDSGIGTDRTSGGGQLEISKGTLDLKTPETAEHQLNLSLYCPKVDGIEISPEVLDQSNYVLLKRGGYIASPANNRHLSIRKKSIYMFEEGSVFPTQTDRIGQIANLKPVAEKGEFPAINHPIWRDGTAIFLPIKI